MTEINMTVDQALIYIPQLTKKCNKLWEMMKKLAKSLCKLLNLGTPKIIIDNEANLFAQNMVIHTYCKEMTTVDDV